LTWTAPCWSTGSLHRRYQGTPSTRRSTRASLLREALAILTACCPRAGPGGLRFVASIRQPTGLVGADACRHRVVATLPALFMVWCSSMVRPPRFSARAPPLRRWPRVDLALVAYASLFWAMCWRRLVCSMAQGVMTLARSHRRGATRWRCWLACDRVAVVTSSHPRQRRSCSPWFWCGSCGRGRGERAAFAAYVAGATATALVWRYNWRRSDRRFTWVRQRAGFDGMKEGIFGVTRPRAEALHGLLISPRGFLCWPRCWPRLVGHAISIARARHSRVAILTWW